MPMVSSYHNLNDCFFGHIESCDVYMSLLSPSIIIHTNNPHTIAHSPPRPPMIPPLPRRKINLPPPILHWHTPPYPPLNHRTAIQPPHVPIPPQRPRIRTLAPSLGFAHYIALAIHEPQMLARRAHRHVHALELEGFGGAALAQEEQPGAVDGPVPEGAGA